MCLLNGVTPVANLYPVPEQVKGYLDNWVRYVDELEARIPVLERAHSNLEQTSSAEIAKLRTELSQIAEPLHQRIAQLEEKLRASERYAMDLASERATAIERLAPALEINANTPGLTILSLINEALVLVDESKKMVREHL
jgi:uncharacterized coiled-coil protein SlyX